MQEKKRKFFFCDRMSEMKEQKGQLILAVSGSQKFGKNNIDRITFVEAETKSLKAAVIKHDGHEFEAIYRGQTPGDSGKPEPAGRLFFPGQNI